MIGNRRERVVIQSMAESTDSEGNPVKTWTTVRTVWARAEYVPMRVAEVQMASQIVSTVRCKFTMNYRSDLTELMRISWRSDFWNIHEVQPSEDKLSMDVLTSRIQ